MPCILFRATLPRSDPLPWNSRQRHPSGNNVTFPFCATTENQHRYRLSAAWAQVTRSASSAAEPCRAAAAKSPTVTRRRLAVTACNAAAARLVQISRERQAWSSSARCSCELRRALAAADAARAASACHGEAAEAPPRCQGRPFLAYPTGVTPGDDESEGGVSWMSS